MSVLPRVTELTRERIAREFDDLGPEACMTDIRANLLRHNPELLDMTIRWAREGEDPEQLLRSFGMFYRLLAAETPVPQEDSALSPLPRVTADTRDLIVERIDRAGDERFTREALANLQDTNPELLQMAHGFASLREDYARTMLGFALLHEALLIQSRIDRANLH